MCESYHLPPPDFNEQTPPETDGTTGTSGTAGTLGTAGTVGSNGPPGADLKDPLCVHLLSDFEQDKCRNRTEESHAPGNMHVKSWDVDYRNPAQYGLILLCDEATMNHQCSVLRYG
jgi:hypothetical protein